MAKLIGGRTWYIQDLDNYNEEYLKEIILDLHCKLNHCKDNLKEKLTNK